MDIEGAEWDAVHGAVETIKKFRPILLLSIYHTPTDFFQIKPFIEKLGCNYRFVVRKLVPESFIAELMLIAYPCDR